MNNRPPDKSLTLLEHLVAHVVLPRGISNKILRDNHQQDLTLIARMTETIESSVDFIPHRILTTFRRFQKVHVNRSPIEMSNQIKHLEPGDTFGMLVRNQKRVLMIHRPKCKVVLNDSDSSKTSVDQSQSSDESEMVTIASFPSAIDPKDIYSHSSDLQVSV